MRKFLFVMLVCAFALIVFSLPPATFSLATLQHYQSQLVLRHAQHPALAACLFFVIYMIVTTLSIPGATLLTLLGGALFGLVPGMLLVAFAATIGATFAMLIARYLLRDWVQKRFSRQMETINLGMEHQGARYLFALRLTPVFPFILVNVLMGLTAISAKRYFVVSLVAMLPAILVYLNAGRQLSQIRQVGDIVSPGMILTLTLLGLLPLASRWLVRKFNI